MKKITAIKPNSYATKAGICLNDSLIAINGHIIADLLDYRFHLTERKVVLSLCRDGTQFDVAITKPEYDDIGLEFATFLMDDERKCANRCIFCFVDQNPPNVRSGAYGDHSCEDELFWASAELYSVTGENRYLEALKKRIDEVDISKFGWRDTAGFGALCCLFVIKEKLEMNLLASIKERFIREADSFFALTKKSGYGTALSADNYVWGSILPILNNAIAMICARLLTGDEKYRSAAQNQLDYLLGMNATGYSFVTGFGERAYRFPHHRPSYADGVDDPVPGLVSGGPNKRFPDTVTKTIIPPDTPPAKFYIDYTPTASANEIAIYWNSPAVFVAAYFNSVS